MYAESDQEKYESSSTKSDQMMESESERYERSESYKQQQAYVIKSEKQEQPSAANAEPDS